jgi:guanosine-3',5'-bis(diphosphate) 3'-pyrophosphohydrolase
MQQFIDENGANTEVNGINPSRIFQALSFSAEKHRHQKRKDIDESPYVLHPIAVATVLAVEGNITDETLLMAALLHDTIEDVEGVTHEVLAAHFGAELADLVKEVTDDTTLTRQERKSLQVEHMLKASNRAKLLKIADKTCNIRDIMHTPPDGWSVERRLEYLVSSKKVVDSCRGINSTLEEVYDSTLRAGEKLLQG